MFSSIGFLLFTVILTVVHLVIKCLWETNYLFLLGWKK